MTLISFVCFLICCVIIASCFRRGADVLSPGRIFGFVWFLAIGMADLKLSRLQNPWGTESWFLLLIGPMAFLCGLYAVYVLELRTKLKPIQLMRSEWKRADVDARKLFTAVTILFLLFLIAYGSISLIRGEIPLFSSKPGLARLNFQLFGVGLFLHNVVFVVFFTATYFLMVRGERARKFLLSSFSLVSVILYGMTLQRFQIVMAAVLCLFLVYYTTRYLRFSTLAIFFSLTVFFFLSISTVRGGQLFMYYLYVDSQMTFPAEYAFLTEPYMYLAMNLEVFARAVEKLQDFSRGFFTFDFIFALTGLKHWLREYFGLVETPYNILGFNTYTAFWTYYRDFGILGLAFFPLVFGCLTANLYYSMKRSPSLQTISFYCIALFTVLFSFYHNFVSFLWYQYNLIGFYLIFRLVRMSPEPRLGKTSRG